MISAVQNRVCVQDNQSFLCTHIISIYRSPSFAPSEEKLTVRSAGGKAPTTFSGHSTTTNVFWSCKNCSGLSAANSSGFSSRYASMCTSVFQGETLLYKVSPCKI